MPSSDRIQNSSIKSVGRTSSRKGELNQLGQEVNADRINEEPEPLKIIEQLLAGECNKV